MKLSKMLKVKGIVFASLCVFSAASAQAQTTKRPRLIVHSTPTITAERITLGSVSQIINSHPEFNKLVEDLKGLELGESPPPRMTASISGLKIVALIRESGIPLESIAYSVPKTVTVTRSGDIISKDEVLNEVQKLFRTKDVLDLQVRDVSWAHAQVVPSGKRTFEIQRMGKPTAGKIPLRVGVLVNGKAAGRFLATAIADDWREVPVLNKSMERGMLIGPEDFELVRLNLFKQPRDVAELKSDVLGRRVKNRIQAGATVRKAFIDIPPILQKGKHVTMKYQQGALRATAVGIALEDGHTNSMIKVRNESSRKIVPARVISENEVVVGAK